MVDTLDRQHGGWTVPYPFAWITVDFRTFRLAVYTPLTPLYTALFFGRTLTRFYPFPFAFHLPICACLPARTRDISHFLHFLHPTTRPGTFPFTGVRYTTPMTAWVTIRFPLLIWPVPVITDGGIAICWAHLPTFHPCFHDVGVTDLAPITVTCCYNYH